MNLILDALKGSGDTSSTRLIMLATAAVILITYLMHNIMAVIVGKGFVDFPAQSVILMGIVLAGKVAQSYGEKK